MPGPIGLARSRSDPIRSDGAASVPVIVAIAFFLRLKIQFQARIAIASKV